MGGVMVTLVLAALALVTGIKAFRTGERSGVLWLGLISAIAVAAFWVSLIIGEIIVPH